MQKVGKRKMGWDNHEEGREAPHNEIAISDFQRRVGGQMSKCDTRGTSISSSLKRNEITQIGRFTGGENYVSE